MEEWERYIKNKERGINYLAPEEAKKLSPEWTSLGGNELTLEKRYSGQSGLIRMLQDKRLRNIAKMITGRIG
jgi:hypothetical protein